MHTRIAVILAFAAAFPGHAAAQSLTADEVYSSIAVSMLAPPDPVQGADGRIHLAYELIVRNPSPLLITLDKVEAIDGAGRSLQTLGGAALATMVAMHGGKDTTLTPGGSAIVFMDTSFAATARLPRAIAARVTITRQNVGADGKPAAYPAGGALPATVSFSGPLTTIGTRKAVIVDAPLRGPRWVALNGCCDALTAHRGAVLAVNGIERAAQRFAIDWVQLQPDLRLATGDRHKRQSYLFYGVPVHAVADGLVVNLYDKAASQIPLSPAAITPESIGGNMVVLDIGGGNFAFFAHLQPNSLRVKLGEHVRRGQVLGLLGNTGNTDLPHLHFQVMDGKSPLNANGLPYVFRNFVGRGVMDEGSFAARFGAGEPLVVKAGELDGKHASQLPLHDEVVDLPE